MAAVPAVSEAGAAVRVHTGACAWPCVMVTNTVALAVPAALCGVVRIVAGIYNLRFRRRGLGLVALGLGLLTLATGYCAPTAIATQPTSGAC